MIDMAQRNLLTMQEAADELGVTRQRMHVIVSTVGAEVEKINPRLTMISREELQKIREKRDSAKNCQN